ncbi:hypothetical protein [Rhizobium giardinii]|uniref:hypothetical protein n=1 Tax=Rhizobium giardinii TaxID=56731 RepID=UPI000DD64706
MLVIFAGAILFICGLLLLFREALARRRLSDPSKPIEGAASPTLEPRRQGLGFLGVSRNWPGLGLMAAGAILLISGAYA